MSPQPATKAPPNLPYSGPITAYARVTPAAMLLKSIRITLPTTCEALLTAMVPELGTYMRSKECRLTAAERRVWIRLHGVSKGSAAVAFAAMEDMFSASRSQSRQLLEAQRLVGHPAPTPGDGLDEGPAVTGRYAGKLTIARTRLTDD